MSSTRFEPSGPLYGWIQPPADKSISHRAALIAAMGEGETQISGYLDAADTRSTLQAVSALGAEVNLGFALKEIARAPDLEARERSLLLPPGLGLTIRGVGLRGANSASIDV